MAGGFLTFGQSCSGLILNNYPSTDILATFARLAICASLLTAYPLVFLSLRRQALDFFQPRLVDLEAANPAMVTVWLLAAVTAVAIKLTDLGLLAAFAGAVFGSFLIYIGPGIM